MVKATNTDLESQSQFPQDLSIPIIPNGNREDHLYLYSHEEGSRVLVGSKVIHSLANYSSVIPASTDSTLENCNNGDSDSPPKKGAELGTLVGVYLPCIQNIFGVILFIRMAWLVGTAGIICGFAIVFMCCCVTLLTSISMSAIATNGVVPAGGSYFMISRSLGPEFGGAVGILFYIGTTFAAAMYIVGAIEILITYMAPSISLFGDTTVPENMYNNYRVYGSLLLAIIGTIVYIGVKFVNKFAPVALACVLGSIVCIYIGIFVNIYGNRNMNMCVLGTRLLQEEGSGNCTKVQGSPLWNTFCKRRHDDGRVECDEYFEKHETKIVQGIAGLASGIFMDNLWPSFMSINQIASSSLHPEDADPSTSNVNGTSVPNLYNQVIVDITTSFTVLVGIFFPSVTGIMAGSNRSGDLKDAQLSIPRGTICAVLTTSAVYLSSVLLFGASFDKLLMRDKFGQSVGGKLVIANIAWPNEWAILVGSFAAAIGAGMQSLTGAPRLLQAIAKDGIVPILEPFCVSNSRGEPTRALMLTLAICEFGVLLGNLDILAPLLSMFFLMCYGFVNLACAVQTLLRTPNWRPRFKYYHWTLSLIGMGLCVTVMFMASWSNALVAMFLAGCVYKYIEFKGAKKEWGDGIRGLSLSAARFSLLRLEEGPPHTKNWRPQILVLLKLTDDSKDKKVLSIVSQLKAGKGLVISATVLDTKDPVEVELAKQTLKRWMETEKVKGFGEVLQCSDLKFGIAAMIQAAGLGGLKPNTVAVGWPTSWSRGNKNKGGPIFMHTMRTVVASNMALLVPKGTQYFPAADDKVSGNIDLWWILQDGGTLLLLAFLLKQHRTWKACNLRIFTVAQKGEETSEMEKDLKLFLYALRIDAQVKVVSMEVGDISVYAYERTLLMEQRNEMLKEMRLNGKGIAKNVENGVVSNGHLPKPNGVIGQIRSSAKTGYTEENARRMHTAVKLNEVIHIYSHDAKLVLINLPSIPRNPENDTDYLEFMEVLTEGINKTLLVRGSGREVITVYS